jgi:protein-disulfide isomerase
MRFLVAALLLSGALTGQYKFDKQALETWVRHLFLWGPQISVSIGEPRPAEIPGFYDVAVVATAGQARQEEKLLVSLDGRRVIRGTVYDVSRSPFAGDLAKFRTDGAASVGPADAPVQLVIFSDLQCSYCAQAAEVLRQKIIPAYPKELRVVFKDMPLDQIHPWARQAAVLGRCILRQKADAFWAYHDWIFSIQAQITPENLRAKVAEFAKSNGLDPEGLNRCADSPSVAAEVEKSVNEARALGLNSTPTMFVNGRRVVGMVAPDQLQKVIEHERDYARMQAR